jgi:flagellin-like hook-associated protein FlgL
MAEVTLTAAMRSNLISLQQTAKLMDQTQTRLSTGLKVNSALDNPTNYFAASAHKQRADDLAARKDGMNEAVQTIKAASTGIQGMKELLASAKGVVETARTTTTSGLSSLYDQFNEIGNQIKQMIQDSGYKGTNFLNGTGITLDVLFNETGTNKLTLNGFDATMSGMFALTGLTAYADVGNDSTNISNSYAFSAASNLNEVAAAITAAISQLAVQSSRLSSNLAIVNARLEFANSMINVEKTGSDNLTLADSNEEGANMLMLQTRNSLGTTALSLASQAAQSVLQLF